MTDEQETMMDDELVPVVVMTYDGDNPCVFTLVGDLNSLRDELLGAFDADPLARVENVEAVTLDFRVMTRGEINALPEHTWW